MPFPRPSTIDLFRQAGSLLGGLHAYVYARWTPAYIRALLSLPSGAASKPSTLGRWFIDRWHGKVLPLEEAQRIVRIDKPISRRDLGEQVIPFPMARDLVLEGPPDIVAYECGCRLRLPNHCEPTQVCLVIGKPGTDFILDHHPHGARRLTQAEALELLKDEHDRGHVHCAWFKHSMGNRMYAICNCCKCCCAGLESMVKRGAPLIVSSGYTAAIDADACILCGDCAAACPFEALTFTDTIDLDSRRCMGCGVCESRCPTQSIALVLDHTKPAPLRVG
jgi:NAD-dependent dihydropyrimidine dehydrogenase PreA subunit